MNINDQVLEAAKCVEKQVDEAIDQLNALDTNDLQALRERRMKELKEREVKLKEWKQNGHGVYEELSEGKQFFDVMKRSENLIVHFYTDTNERCRIVDKHFKVLAAKHVEALFTKLNAEKCPFLVEKLKIKVIPCIILIQNGIVVDRIIGFSTIGNRDDFSTADMEWRLAQNELIEYNGDLSVMPSDHIIGDGQKPNGKIRNGLFNRDDDDLYEEDTKPRQNYELSADEEAELGI